MFAPGIPDPPYLAPLPTPTISTAPNGLLTYFYVEWYSETGRWATSTFLTTNWDAFPSGYQVAPFSAPGRPILIVVVSRSRPDGSVAPNVLAYPNWIVVADKGGNVATSTSPDPQPPPPPSPSPQCPPGFLWVPPSIADTWPIGGGDSSDNPYGQCIPIGLTWPLWALQPNCPPGTTWDPTTETCKATSKPPPPVCPAGTQWDPITASCKPIKKPPPPVCPPGTQWDPFSETCKPIFIPPPPGQPCIPLPSQWDDELTAGLNCVSENLIVIQQLLQQQKQGAEPPQLDPVTCTQLSYLVNLVDTTLLAIARAISTYVSTPQPPIDLTPITTMLLSIARQLQAIADKPDSLAGPPAPDQPIDDSFAAFLKSAIDAWAADGTIDAGDAQTVG